MNTSTSALLDDVLGVQSKVRLIRAFHQASRPLTGREAARLAGVSQRPANLSLRDLTDKGILLREVHPREHHFQLNREHFLVRKGILPLFEAEIGSQDALLAALREALNPLATGSLPSVQSALLLPTNGASAPLLVVTRSQQHESAVWASLRNVSERAEAEFGLEIEILVLSIAALADRHSSGDATVASALNAGSHVAGKPLRDLVRVTAVPEVEVDTEVEPEVTTSAPAVGLLALLRSRTRR
jgi:hypothetical protein